MVEKVLEAVDFREGGGEAGKAEVLEEGEAFARKEGCDGGSDGKGEGEVGKLFKMAFEKEKDSQREQTEYGRLPTGVGEVFADFREESGKGAAICFLKILCDA